MSFGQLPRVEKLFFVAVACMVWISGACGEEEPAVGDQGATAAPESPRVAAGNASEVDPCDLLTAEDIEEVTGKAPGGPTPSSHGPECSWTAADGSDPRPLASVSAQVSPETPDSYEEYVEYNLETLGELTSRDTYNEVEGLGDYAVWEGPSPEFGGLVIVDGDVMVYVSTQSAGGRSARENSIALGQKAIERLP